MSYTNKTQPTTINPKIYLKKNFTGNEKVYREALVLVDVYTKATGFPCVMWNKIFGFGKYSYLDSRGGSHTHLMTGFAISTTGFTLYNMMGWAPYKKKIEKLGSYKISGKSCLAIRSTENIDLRVLVAVIQSSLADMKRKYKTDD